MTLSHEHERRVPHENGAKNWIRSWSGIASCIAIAVLAFLILRDHAAHVLGAAPYLLLLACPLMHLFMHRGHGHHHLRRDERKE